MMAFGNAEDVGRRLGMFMTIFSLGALAGPPISGAINTATGGFEAVGYYAGTMLVDVSVTIVSTRCSFSFRLDGASWGSINVPCSTSRVTSHMGKVLKDLEYCLCVCMRMNQLVFGC